MGTTDITLMKAFADWQESRGLSGETVRRRKNTLNTFHRSIQPLTLAQATMELVEEWIATHRAVRTRAAYLSDVKAFYRWARKRRLVKTDPTVDIDPIKVPKSLPRPLHATPQNVIMSARDDDTRLMLAIGIYTGIRLSEIARLTSADIALHVDPPMLIVRQGKGNKDRHVPIHPELAKMLRWRREDGRLFNITAGSISRRIVNHLASIGIAGTTHQLRHTFGTEVARATKGNMVMVKELMGHESIQTSMGYVGWNGGPAAEAVALMFKPPPAA